MNQVPIFELVNNLQKQKAINFLKLFLKIQWNRSKVFENDEKYKQKISTNIFKFW